MNKIKEWMWMLYYILRYKKNWKLYTNRGDGSEVNVIDWCDLEGEDYD